MESAVLVRKQPAPGNEAVSRARNVADLLALPPDVVQFGTLNAGLIIRSLRTSNSTLQKALFTRMRQQQQQQTSRASLLPSSSSFAQGPTLTAFTATNDAGIHRVRDGGGGHGHSPEYAFVLPRPIADFVARRRPCDLRVVVDRELPVERWALAVQRGSGLRAQLNRAVTSLMDAGFFTQIYAKWILDDTECIGSGGGAAYGGKSNVRSSKMLSSRAATAGGASSSSSAAAATFRASAVGRTAVNRANDCSPSPIAAMVISTDAARTIMMAAAAHGLIFVLFATRPVTGYL